MASRLSCVVTAVVDGSRVRAPEMQGVGAFVDGRWLLCLPFRWTSSPSGREGMVLMSRFPLCTPRASYFG